MSAIALRDPRLGSVELVPTMGTVISVDVRSEVSPVRFDRAAREVADRLREIDTLFSAWKPDSWVSRLIDGRVCPDDCPVDVQQVLRLAAAAEDLTGGYFSPFWRHGDAGRIGPDPTGLVKGWAAQQASDILLRHEIRDHVVNAAGDLVVSGAAAGAHAGRHVWRIGLSDARGGHGLLGVVELDTSSSRWSVATSGTAEAGHHVIDPHSGIATTAIRAATTAARLDAVSEAGAITDACATALVAAGRDAGSLLERLAQQGVASVLVGEDGTVHDPGALVTPC